MVVFQLATKDDRRIPILMYLMCLVCLSSCQLLEVPRSYTIFLRDKEPIHYCTTLHRIRPDYALSNVNIFNRMGESVHIYTYISTEILDYAPEAAAVNAWYASRHNYSFHVYTSETGHNFEPKDQRWNKVKILLDAMNSHELGCLIVWVDADLIVLDMDLDLREVVQPFASADIFMSKDGPDAPTIANTGMIVIRNSQWAQRVIHRWWYESDRGRECDQIALSHMYASLLADEQDHDKHRSLHNIHIQSHAADGTDKGEDSSGNNRANSVLTKFRFLRTDALNSNFPAWQHQLPHNQILHLAGMSGKYRHLVFQKALRQLCESAVNVDGQQDNPDHVQPSPSDRGTCADESKGHLVETACQNRGGALPLQLGLTRQALFKLYGFAVGQQLAPLQASIEEVSTALANFSPMHAHDTLTSTNENIAIDTPTASVAEMSHVVYWWEQIWAQVDSIHGDVLDILKVGPGIEHYHNIVTMLIWCTHTYQKATLSIYRLEQGVVLPPTAPPADGRVSGGGGFDLLSGHTLAMIEKLRMVLSSSYDVATFVGDSLRLQSELNTEDQLLIATKYEYTHMTPYLA